MSTRVYDVVIAGGGLAGLCLARQLAMTGQALDILVLEKQRHPIPAAAVKVGESTVEIGAYYFAEYLALQDHIEAEHLPKYGLRFYYKEKHQGGVAEGQELGLTRRFPTPSYQLERGTLENHIGAKLADQGVDFQDGAVIRGLEMNEENGPHQVHYRRDGVDHSVQCRWFVDASGRRQLLKRQLGIQQDISHSMNAVWFRLNTRIKIDEFEDLYPLPGPVLDRWISTNHLMGEGYWVWLIPLAGGATSVGIVADPQYHALSSLNNFERALDWLREHQPSVATVVENNRHTLMDFLALKNYAHGCQQVFSPQRWAMTGEAGVFLDPFYSPGSDFIGMSNTLITELILADRRQRPPKAMIEAYNDLYLNLFQNTLTVYRGQYGVFGNPVVMSAKITWDYAAYWCFPALAFCHRRLGQLALDQSSDTILREMGALNSRMQKFFRKWHAIYQPHPVKGMINQGQYELLHALNAELIEPIEDGQAFQKRLAHNLDRLRALAVEMIAVAADNKPELARFASDLEPPAFSVDYAAFHRSIVEPLQAETV